MSLLTVKDLGKSFGGVKAVDGITFEIAAGELLALIGPNGAGKSTTFNMLNGQLQADRGSIRFAGQELLGLAPREIWRLGVGRTFQIAETFSSLTVIENVQMALLSHAGRIFSFFKAARLHERERALELLEQVGMASQAERPCSALAYSDVKRVELAIALANRPRLLLMDEPTAGMAPKERNALMTLTKKLVIEQQIAVLFTEHSMDVVFAHADRMIVLARGRLIAQGVPDDIRKDAKVQEVYFGSGATFEDEIAVSTAKVQAQITEQAAQGLSNVQTTEEPSQSPLNVHALTAAKTGAREARLARAAHEAFSAPNQAELLLSVQYLCAWYGAAQILYDVNIQVKRGEVVALMGRNGAGKSTTMKALMGLLEKRSGMLQFMGSDISKDAAHRIAASGLGYVPEDRRIFTDLTVLENLEVGRQKARVWPDGVAAPAWTVQQLFTLFPNLGEMPKRPGGQMSGGEQQMLTVARSLMGNPYLVLLDEPSEGVAPVIVEQMVQMILALKKQGVSILLSEQNLHFARLVCDRAYVLEKGQIRFSGTMAELDSDEHVRQTYLNV
jgi:branched-chain amino acid transport system ATP-binding protein